MKNFKITFIFLQALLISFSSKATDYYWVGGGGSNAWSTFGNWRIGSPTGGTPSTYPSNPIDNVFFGSYSTFLSGAITMPSTPVSVNNFSVSGCPTSPTITSSSAVLNVYGGFVLQSSMGLTLGTLNFASNSPQTITTSSVTISANVNITGNGNYTITDIYRSSGYLTNSGNGNFLSVGSFTTVGFTKSGAGNLDFMNTTKFVGDVKLSGGGMYNFNAAVTGGNFYFTNGVLNTNNYDFNIGLFSDNGATTPHTLNAGITQFTLSAGGGAGGGCWIGTWNYTGAGGILNLTIPGSKIFVTACGYLCSNNRFVGKSGDRYYDVWFSNCGNQGINGNGMSFNSIVFDGDGVFQGNSNNIKTIIFNGGGSISGSNTFTTAIFNGDGSFTGNSSFSSLTLNGYNYTFASSSTQSITTAFTATVPSCTGLKEMNASTTTQANLNISTSATTVLSNNSKFSGINVIGTPLVSTGSYDNGNNTNIIFPTPTPKTLYWVGGTGNWNDPNHWSLVNDGVYPPVSGCVPTLLDNVIFNANSGAISTVSLTGAPAYCHDISWLGASGTPTLAIPSTHTLSIYGSVILQNSLIIRTPNILMMSSSTESITCNGARFGDASASIYGTVTFSTTGTWQCQDDFYAQCVILNRGSLISNNHYMNMFRMASAANTTLTIGTSTLDVTFSGAFNWTIWSCAGIINTNVGSLINIYGSYSTWPWFGFHTASNQTYYDVIFHNTTGGTYGVMKIGTNNVYHDVIFKKGGYVESNNTIFNRLDFCTPITGNSSTLMGNSNIGTLNCYGPYSFAFESAKTQTITTSLNITNTPCGAKAFISSSSTTPSVFNVTGTSFLNINDAYISNTTISGGSINALNSINSGGNTNITFGVVPSKTLYWIGNSGNWNDKGHWTTDTILDRIYPSTTGCVPTRFDDVVFIGALTGFTTSSTVALGTGSNAECKNISWLNAIGNPKFDVGKLSIYGSIVGQATMRWETAFDMITNTGSTATITSNGMSFIHSYEDITFLGGGARMLADNFKQDPSGIWTANVLLKDGVLNTNNNNFDVCVMTASANSTLIIGSSTIKAYGWSTNGTTTPVLASIGSNINITSACCVAGGSSFSSKATDVYQDVLFVTSPGNTGELNGGGARFNNVTFNPCRGSVKGNNKINKLTFLDNGSIANNNYIDTLVLSAGKIYALQSAGTQTVNSRLYASGNNCAKIVLNSTTSGTRAKLQVNAGAVNYAFGEIKDIDATPSYTPLVYSVASTDFGNNLNVSISGAVPTTSNGIASNYSVAVTSMTLCNNQMPVTFNTNNYFPNPTTVFNWSNGSHADTLVANVAGMYSVGIVYAVSGVPCTLNAAINLVVNTTSVTVSVPASTLCVGNNIPITASGANSYTWSPSIGLSSSTISNPIITPTTSTTYTVLGTNTITGCYDKNTVSLLVNPTPSITAFSSNNVSCNGASTASAQITASGGTPSYTYNWSSLLTTTVNTISGLSAGIYTSTVTDINNCFASQQFTVTQPLPMLTGATTNSIACFGIATGSLISSPTGGNPTYTYYWTDGLSTYTTQNVSNVSSGVYSITVTDTKSCTTTNTIQVLEPLSPITSTLSGISNVLCFGASTGSATIMSSGGTGTPTYSWSPGSLTTSTVTGLSANLYTVITTDGNGCATTKTLSITQPTSGLSIAAISTNSVLCFGANSGSVNLTATGGTPSYTTNWSGPSSYTAITTGTLNSISVPAGTYSASVTDFNGCSTSTTAIVIEPLAALTSTLTSNNVLCNGGVGSASITASGGTTGYTYLWSNAATTTTISTIAGVYTVTITDANACTSIKTVTITQPSALTSSLSGINNVLCYGANTGSASVTAAGGTGTLTYNWIPSGGTTTTATSLAANFYTVTVTDANGCMDTKTLSITQPTSGLSITSVSTNSVLCYGTNSGTVNLTATGGTPSYTTSWSGPSSYTATTTGFTNSIPASTGTYSATITDANGCITSTTAIVSGPTSSVSVALSGSVSPTNCTTNTGIANVNSSGGTGSGYIYTWINSTGTNTTAVSTNTGLPLGTTTVSIIDGNSCESNSITINVTSLGAPTVAISTNSILCNGGNGWAIANVTGTAPFDYIWQSSTSTTNNSGSLIAGTYSVLVNETSTGCKTIQTFTLSEPTALATAISNIINVNCFGGNNGSASVTTTGGTPIYSYSWLPTGGSTSTGTNLAQGIYTVTITDNNNCTKTNTVEIQGISEDINISITDTVKPDCGNYTNGSITVGVTGGTPTYTYLWNNGSITPSNTNITNSTYTVTVTDANNCSKQLEITLDCFIKLFIPEIFSPNNDGKNDVFEIKGIQNYPNNKLSIFNRWGNLVYKKENYNNDWDGKPNVNTATGKDLLPQGTYYVLLDFGDDGKTKTYTGYLQLDF